MLRTPAAAAEIFTVHEIARAAGVSSRAVRELVESGQVGSIDGSYLGASQAVRCIRLLHAPAVPEGRREIFATRPAGERSPGAGILGSTLLHGALLAGLVLMTTFGISAKREDPPQRIDPSRIVFLVTPGPGGGGGGGGLKQPKPPAKAEMKTKSPLRSPVPPPKQLSTRKPEPRRVITPPPVVQPVVRRVEPPPPPVRPPVTPQVVAPVVTASSDARDRAGIPAEAAPESDSQGIGSGGGAGTGQGTGIGEGTGPGIGPGSGGGTGGGPYRPGSGITAPELLREVKPEYTEDARRRGIEGEVVLEIVVRRDGSVGEVKVIQGLAGGLDRRAIEAVRQWRFSPAKRYATPVDVLVEIAVEFKLR